MMPRHGRIGECGSDHVPTANLVMASGKLSGLCADLPR
jgi:hypothetical protein